MHLLADDLSWAGEHVSDLALGALADGQDEILSLPVRHHVSSCEACTARLGELALMSLEGTLAFDGSRQMERCVEGAVEHPFRPAVPKKAVLVAVLACLLGFVPFSGDIRAAVSLFFPVGRLAVRAFASAGRALVSSPTGSLVSLGCALFLVSVGILVSKHAVHGAARSVS